MQIKYLCAQDITIYHCKWIVFACKHVRNPFRKEWKKKARGAHTISHIYHTIPGILSPHFIRNEFLHFVGRTRSTDRRFLALILPLIRYRVVVVAVSLTHARSLARRSFVLNFIFHLSFASNWVVKSKSEMFIFLSFESFLCRLLNRCRYCIYWFHFIVRLLCVSAATYLILMWFV